MPMAVFQPVQDANFEAAPSKPFQVDAGRVTTPPRPQVHSNALRRPRPRRLAPFGTPPPPSDLLHEHTAGSSPEGSVVIAPQIPEDTANSALVTAHHGSTLAGGRFSKRMIDYCIRKVCESYRGGIALSSTALEFVRAALLRGRPAVRTTVQRLMDTLRGLMPETIAILGPIWTNETTPAGHAHAHAPIPGAYASLREEPETAPAATPPSSTNETSALVLQETPTVQSEPESSEEHHSDTGKDRSEVVSAPTKLKTAPQATSPSSTNEASALVLHETPTVPSEPEASGNVTRPLAKTTARWYQLPRSPRSPRRQSF
jgi:hypothetical protein